VEVPSITKFQAMATSVRNDCTNSRLQSTEHSMGHIQGTINDKNCSFLCTNIKVGLGFQVTAQNFLSTICPVLLKQVWISMNSQQVHH